LDLGEDRRYAPAVSIHLDGRPRIGFRPTREAGILGLYANEVGVAAREALPIADPGVVAPASRNDKKCAVAPKTKLGQWTREIRSAVGHNA
jgi:hypothetical protein